LLFWGSWVLPLGFFLGGFGLHGGDPGLGVLLVPVGALLLLLPVSVAPRAPSAGCAEPY